ncbi:MAG: PKD domain-containing protein [Thermoplasmata archaeon]|nr:PKD domain-containing protein [Thermoplasmata archaeon]
MAVVLALLLSVPMVMTASSEEGTEESGVEQMPTRAAFETFGNGPIVNVTVITFEDLDEGFDEIEDLLILTRNKDGDSSDEVFFDPNQEWKWKTLEPSQGLRYPNKTFEVKYPWIEGSAYDGAVEVRVNTDFDSTSFSYVTLRCLDNDFNYMKYHEETGLEYLVVRVFAENRSGRSMMELRFKVQPVNDAPKFNPEGLDFYFIEFPEDTMYWGINVEHDQVDRIFTDWADAPFDSLVYQIEPTNFLADNITVELSPDGINITFTPEENWACPWVSESARSGPKNWSHARFMINCTDLDGEGLVTVPDRGSLGPYFWVYVAPENDPPEVEIIPEVSFFEDEVVEIQLEANDPDLDQGQVIHFGTNATEVLPDIPFNPDYEWDNEEGFLSFSTNNDMVGDYDIAFWVQDVASSESPPRTPYRTYMNMTIHVINVNDPPEGVIDSPSSSSSFVYNTSAGILFDASRSRDPDIIHGEVLNYTWYVDDLLIGYGAKLTRVISEEGLHEIKLNVTDGLNFDLKTLQIEVKKTRVYGEIYDGEDIDRSGMDNSSDPLVLLQSQSEMKILFGGKESVDIIELQGEKGNQKYEITVWFSARIDNFVFGEDKQQEPRLIIYFMKPDYGEEPPYLTVENIPQFEFSEPSRGDQYGRLEFDLYAISFLPTASTSEISPQIRIRDDNMGVDISMTLPEMDLLGILPNFELTAVALMETRITDFSGMTTKITSYDSAGYGSKEPVVQPTEVGSEEKDEGTSIGLIILIIILVILVLAALAAVVVIIVMKKGSGEEEVEATPAEVSGDEILSGIAPEESHGLNAYGGGDSPGLPGYVPKPGDQPAEQILTQDPQEAVPSEAPEGEAPAPAAPEQPVQEGEVPEQPVAPPA